MSWYWLLPMWWNFSVTYVLGAHLFLNTLEFQTVIG